MGNPLAVGNPVWEILHDVTVTSHDNMSSLPGGPPQFPNSYWDYSKNIENISDLKMATHAR